MKLRETPEGKAYLHIYRSGMVYEEQKGELFKKDWTNVEYTILPIMPKRQALAWNARGPLPYPDNSFDAMYSYHVMEHLLPDEGIAFMKEIFRLLKPGGICRLSTPNLESKVRRYIQALEEVQKDPSENNKKNYEWAIVELLDQQVREKHGGLQWDLISSGKYDPEYIREITGDAFIDMFKVKEFRKKPLLQRIQGKSLGDLWAVARRKLMIDYLGYTPFKTREATKWLYDDHSLTELFKTAGFINVESKDFRTSSIPQWDRYQFDQSNYGDYGLEDGVFAEGRKPPKGGSA